MSDAPYGGRRRLTVTEPDNFALNPELETCRLCDGSGSIGASDGDCPACEGGRFREIVRVVFTVGTAVLEVTMSERQFTALVAQGELALATLASLHER